MWDEDFDTDTESSETDPLVSGLEGQGTIEHLRGENWHVMSVDGDLLDEMQQNFGGERNEQGFPDLNGLLEACLQAFLRARARGSPYRW